MKMRQVSQTLVMLFGGDLTVSYIDVSSMKKFIKLIVMRQFFMGPLYICMLCEQQHLLPLIPDYTFRDVNTEMVLKE